MPRGNHRIAIAFDFDETLTSDSITQLLLKHGVDSEEFWSRKLATLIEEGWDSTEAYMMLLVKEMKARNKLDELKPHKLREFGANLQLFDGIFDMFSTLRKRIPDGVTIQFFVISGGLQEIVGGALESELTDYWGCTFDDGSNLGVLYPKNVISFTEKTKYLFQINKGIIGARYKNKPYEVNEYMEPRARAVPLTNIIYIGDGLTDVPCFSILEEHKGHSIVVYNEDQRRREGIQRAVKVARYRKAWGPYRANYSRDSSIRNLIEEIALGIAEKLFEESE